MIMKCKNKAKFRYTWPGRDESYCCEEHAKGIQIVAQVIGAYQQMIPIEESEIECNSND